ncbi:MAG TPA: glycosyltransferase family 4 protein [Blastocatellia bacterium]|nr:glycosyltransferase family 4 protein [Blastocatellia bacterium]
MRILLIHPSDHLNGAGRILGALAKYLRGRGHTTLAVLPGEGPLTRILKEDIGEYVCVPMRVPRRSLRVIIQHHVEFFPTVRRLARIIRDWRADVVHVNCLYTLWGGMAARTNNVPAVYHIHEAPGSYPHWLYRGWQAVVSHLAARVVIVHASLASALPSCQSKLTVIENGIDRERFGDRHRAEEWRRLVAPHDEKVILCPSHIMPGKNQKLLVEAAPLIFGQCPRAKIVFLGRTHGIRANEEYLRRLKSLAAQNGSSGSILFTSEPEDATQVMAGADVIVSPSPYESFGLVPLEALAAGKPVVLLRTGIADALSQYGCPVRVASNSAESLAEAVIEALSLTLTGAPDLLPAHFTAERMADQFETVYRSLLLVPS